MIGMAMLALTSIAVMAGCTKDPMNNLTEEESRIYITNRDSNADFGAYKTYSIPDSVYVISNNSMAGQQATAWDLRALDAVRRNLESRGYKRVSRTQSPDLGINVSRIFNTTTSLVNLQDYWGGYGGYYDPYYWGYGGYGYDYPPAYGYVESTEAMLSVDILDLKNASANGSIKVIWNGLVRGSGIFNNSAVDSQIKALFDQSPYLRTIQ